MHNGGFTAIGKANASHQGARGLEYEDLPFGMSGQPGPTAFRSAPSPLRRLGSSEAKMDSLAIIIDELQKPVWRRKRTRRELLQALDQYVVAERAGQRV